MPLNSDLIINDAAVSAPSGYLNSRFNSKLWVLLNGSSPTLTAPSGVTDLAVQSVTGAVVALDWTAPSDGGRRIFDYIVEYKLGDAAWRIYNTPVSAATDLLFTAPESGLYQFRVTPVNYIGEGAVSNITSPVSVSVPAYPLPITDLAVSIVGSTATLTHTAPNTRGASITDYLYQYRSSTASNWTTFAEPTNGTPGTSILGLPTGNYSFRAFSRNSVGMSWSSNTATGTISNFTAPSVTTLSGTYSGGNVVLSHTAPANGGSALTQYEYQYRIGSTAAWTVLLVAAGSGPGTTISNLDPAIYNIQYRAINAVGPGPWSNTVSVTVPTTFTAPLPPTGLAATNTADGQVTLVWNTPPVQTPPITDYVIQSKPIYELDWVTFTDGVGAVSRTVVTGLPNSIHEFRVAAVNSNGQGSFCPAAQAIVLTLRELLTIDNFNFTDIDNNILTGM
jgi:hypothetical protein